MFIYNWQGEKDYVKIMNVAVHPEYRLHGHARMLLNHVTAEMEKAGMKRFCGETRVSTTAMQRAFTQCGYKLNRIEENDYDNPPENAWKYALQR